MPYLVGYVQIEHITWQVGSLRLAEVKSRASMSAASAERFSGPILLEFAAFDLPWNLVESFGYFNSILFWSSVLTGFYIYSLPC